MFLKSIKYCRFKGQKYEWSMEGKPINEIYDQPVTFQNINFIVGKNATGKSKTINAIKQLSDLLSGDIKLSQLMYNTSIYDLIFDNNGNEISYYLEFEEGKVKQELLKINGITKLTRNIRKGTMLYEKALSYLDFKMENDKLAVARVDRIQQPFFELLQNWGKRLNFYKFGDDMGQNSFIKDVNAIKKYEEVDLKNDQNIPKIFVLASLKFPNFQEIIVQDMNKIGYKLTSIQTQNLNYISINNIIGVAAKEKDIEIVTDQEQMSQGMFRALSLLVQLNFSLLSKTPSCILIDDIGEGLDYERSKSLIDLIIEKVKDSPIHQIIMTTNNKYVMNNVPLEYWSAISRIPKKSVFYNYQNSKEIFDDFEYTGLSNSDFLSENFYFNEFEHVDK